MEKQMSKRLKLGLIVAILAIVAVIATFSAMVLIQHYTFERRAPATSFVRGDFELFYVANTIISTCNIALLGYLDIYLR